MQKLYVYRYRMILPGQVVLYDELYKLGRLWQSQNVNILLQNANNVEKVSQMLSGNSYM